MELLGVPADDGPKCLWYGRWFLAGHLLEHGNLAVTVNEVDERVQIAQTVEGFTRHRAGERISAYDDVVNFFLANFLKHSLKSREVAMHVIDGSDSHETALNRSRISRGCV